MQHLHNTPEIKEMADLVRGKIDKEKWVEKPNFYGDPVFRCPANHSSIIFEHNDAYGHYIVWQGKNKSQELRPSHFDKDLDEIIYFLES